MISQKERKRSGMYPVGPPMAMELMLSHDFIKELARELEFVRVRTGIRQTSTMAMTLRSP
jgi:hypothetical protein